MTTHARRGQNARKKIARIFLTVDLETTIAKERSETFPRIIQRVVIPKNSPGKEGEERQPLRPLATLNKVYLKDHSFFLVRSNSRRELGLRATHVTPFPRASRLDHSHKALGTCASRMVAKQLRWVSINISYIQRYPDTADVNQPARACAQLFVQG